MHSTFTGSSRRTRNVNLSGQNHNPFASVWAPSGASSTGVSKTVSDAQAERQQRQQAREQVKAGRRIYLFWKGSRARKSLRESRRASLDAIYASRELDPHQRLSTGLPLLLATFQANEQDVARLGLVARDLARSPSELESLVAFSSDERAPWRSMRLAEILMNALELRGFRQETESEAPFLPLLARLASLAPNYCTKIIDRYFNFLARLSTYTTGLEFRQHIAEAILAPLMNQQAYTSFAFELLTKDDTGLDGEVIDGLSQKVDIEGLSTAIIEAYTGDRAHFASTDDLLWLLARFIDLHQKQYPTSERLVYLEALHVQLSYLSPQISDRLPLSTGNSGHSDYAVEGRSRDATGPLPPYVASKASSLVDPAGISALLTDLTASFSSRGKKEGRGGASLLAAYIITLLLCFPSRGDEIRMRLFMGDILTAQGDVPVMRFLWQSMSQTTLYKRITQDATSVVDLVRAYLSGSSNSRRQPGEENEWRLVILFLELYIFVLRISDDDDFFSCIFPSILQDDQPPSRLRACGLSLQETESLTAFLKSLAFTLHHNAADILRNLAGSGLEGRLESYLGNNSTNTSVTKGNRSTLHGDSALSRPSVDNLRSTVTSALRLLYERDSRRPFLPPNHWLMTSKFDMEAFVAAVVAEQERQQEELANAPEEEDEDEEIDEDATMGGIGSSLRTAAGQRLSRLAQIEHLRSRQRRAQRDRMLSVIGPKLEILRNMPFVIPFDTRVQIFRHFVELDKMKRRQGMDAEQWRMTMIHNPLMPGHSSAAKHRAKVTRGSEFDDAFEQFYELDDGLKEPIQIQFVDRFGEVEAGIDGGGVTKEFLIRAIDQAFSGDEEYFVSNKQGLLYPNPIAVDRLKNLMRNAEPTERQDLVQDLLRRYEFMGRLVGKCLYEGILVDISFAGFFLLKWATGQTGENSYRGSINDLRDLDEGLYKSMLKLKNDWDSMVGLDLDFTILDQVSGSNEEPVQTVTRNLMPNGDQVPVTKDNRLLYASYFARHRLVAQPAQQTAAFLRGLRAIIAPTWLSMFNQNELQRLVGGDSSEINLDDLRRHTAYSGLYAVGDDGLEHPTVQHFWNVMRGFGDRERRLLLKYVTSTPRAPLLGFSQLNPRFSIRDGGTDQTRLPSTSTCVNLLKLPRYDDEGTLRRKLLQAIESGAGFDLS